MQKLTTKITLALAAALLLTLGAVYILFASTSVLVKEVPASVTITVVPTEVCGDQNNSGHVDIFDAIIDLQIIVGLIKPTPQQQQLSDVVQDGEINIFDVTFALQHIVGLAEINGCGPPP